MSILYKYRGLSNLEFALDIFINSRLYAANFRDLNDPMEGRFVYARGQLQPGMIDEIRGSKTDVGIVSLSETTKNMLMWSYYADAHSGFVVGIEIDDSRASIRPIEYAENLRIGDLDTADAKTILSRKLVFWSHELEQRVFIPVREYDPIESRFVKVKVKELVFGLHAKGPKVEILRAVAHKFCPEIKVSSIGNANDLDTGTVEPIDFPEPFA